MCWPDQLSNPSDLNNNKSGLGAFYTGSQSTFFYQLRFDLLLRVLVAWCHLTSESSCSLSLSARTLRSTDQLLSETPRFWCKSGGYETFPLVSQNQLKSQPFHVRAAQTIDHSEAWLEPSSSSCWILILEKHCVFTLTYPLLHCIS